MEEEVLTVVWNEKCKQFEYPSGGNRGAEMDVVRRVVCKIEAASGIRRMNGWYLAIISCLGYVVVCLLIFYLFQSNDHRAATLTLLLIPFFGLIFMYWNISRGNRYEQVVRYMEEHEEEMKEKFKAIGVEYSYIFVQNDEHIEGFIEMRKETVRRKRCTSMSHISNKELQHVEDSQMVELFNDKLHRNSSFLDPSLDAKHLTQSLANMQHLTGRNNKRLSAGARKDKQDKQEHHIKHGAVAPIFPSIISKSVLNKSRIMNLSNSNLECAPLPLPPADV